MLSSVKSCRFISVIVLSSLFLLWGCNPDVFIDRLEASQSEFTFPMLGGTADICMSHGDWRIDRVSVDRVDVEGWVTDENGNETYSDISLDGLGSAVFHSESHEFVIVRDEPDHLMVDLGQSVDVGPRLIELHLVNDFESLVISITIDGCSGYTFDRIEYSDVNYHIVNQYDEAWSLNVENATGDVLVQEWAVFNDDACRSVNIPASAVQSDNMPHPHWYAELLRYMDDEAFDIPVPSPYLKDGEIVMRGMEIPFVYGVQHRQDDFPDDKIRVELEPGPNKLRVFWEYEEYSVDYTVWLKNETGGKPLSFTGTLFSKAYTGRWTYLCGLDYWN